MTKTDFAIRLLLDAYADDNGGVDTERFMDYLTNRITQTFKDHGDFNEEAGYLKLNSDKPTIPLLETIADISYAAGAAGHTSGNSREDVQNFIYLAHKFEEEWEGHDWNEPADPTDPDYMEAVDEFAKTNLRLVKKLAFDYPQGLVKQWDNLEVAACKDDGTNTYRLDDDSEEPDFWTVYVHMVEGGAMAIADLPTEKHATDLAELINNAVISFKDNGFMALTRNAELYTKFNQFLDDRIRLAGTKFTSAAYIIVKKQFNDLIKR